MEACTPPRQPTTLLIEAEAQFQEAKRLLDNFATPTYMKQIVQASKRIYNCLQAGGKVLTCGNGGSACDAMHFAEELSGRFRKDRPALPAIALTDPAHISCVGNDYGFEYVFSRYVEALGKKDDILLAFSTSGRSPNIIYALKAAKKRGMSTIVLTSTDNNLTKALSNVKICVPHIGFSDRIQEIHIKIVHTLIHLVEKQLFSWV